MGIPCRTYLVQRIKDEKVEEEYLIYDYNGKRFPDVHSPAVEKGWFDENMETALVDPIYGIDDEMIELDHEYTKLIKRNRVTGETIVAKIRTLNKREYKEYLDQKAKEHEEYRLWQKVMKEEAKKHDKEIAIWAKVARDNDRNY